MRSPAVDKDSAERLFAQKRKKIVCSKGELNDGRLAWVAKKKECWLLGPKLARLQRLHQLAGVQVQISTRKQPLTLRSTQTSFSATHPELQHHPNRIYTGRL